jgi:hypothetical protein
LGIDTPTPSTNPPGDPPTNSAYSDSQSIWFWVVVSVWVVANLLLLLNESSRAPLSVKIGFAVGFILLQTALTVSLAAATFYDALRSGIYKIPGKRSFLNISPLAWGLLTVFFFGVTFPLYVINRNRLRTIHTKNDLFVAVVVLGVIRFAMFALTIKGFF